MRLGRPGNETTGGLHGNEAGGDLGMRLGRPGNEAGGDLGMRLGRPGYEA